MNYIGNKSHTCICPPVMNSQHYWILTVFNHFFLHGTLDNEQNLKKERCEMLPKGIYILLFKKRSYLDPYQILFIFFLPKLLTTQSLQCIPLYCERVSGLLEKLLHNSRSLFFLPTNVSTFFVFCNLLIPLLKFDRKLT